MRTPKSEFVQLPSTPKREPTAIVTNVLPTPLRTEAKRRPLPYLVRGQFRTLREPMVRVELTTYRLRGGCSATELHRRRPMPSVNDVP